MRRRTLFVLATTVLAVLGLAAPAWAQPGGASPTNSLLLLIAAAGAGTTLFLLAVIVFGPNANVEKDLKGRLGRAFAAGGEGENRIKNPLLRRFVNKAESVAERRGLLGMIETALEQADMPIRPGEAIAGAIAVALAVGLIAGVVTGTLLVGPIVAVLVLFASSAAVQFIARRERTRFEAQLPDTLNLISTSLRAGYSLLQALEAVASEAAEPSGREFGRALNETRLGRSPVDALKDSADRMESVDFDWAVMAISIQREVGGNLAEVLQTAAETMMQRNRLRREMKALTAEGRISAIVLGIMPFALFGFLFVSNRNYLEPLFTSVPGIAAIIGSIMLMIAGMVWMSRIVQIEV